MRISTPSSTAWRWTPPRTSALPTGRRSTSIAIGSRPPWAGSRCAFSAWPPEPGVALAHHLGRALQLTNILRDIDEDASLGRLYLPREALGSAGVTTDDPQAAAADPKLAGACVEVAARAREHFDKAGLIMAAAPRAAVKAPRLMAAAYGSILDRMLADGFAPPRRRAKASRLRLIGALLLYGVP